MNASDFQFYPTPITLAQRAWKMFKNKNFARVLEPSAGDGALIKGMPDFESRYSREVAVDCCEIDIAKHVILRSLPGVNVVGMDFMQYGGGAIYSHIIMNPPFATGANHVLRAWEAMFDGEIVAIINAETLRNPFSRERQHLVRLVEQHGEVEFVEGAFLGDEVQRETAVDIALVYLRKQSNVGEDIVGALMDDLKQEDEMAQADRMSDGYKEDANLAVPTTVVENHVMAFELAVRTMRDSVLAEAKANHYSGAIGMTMAEMSAQADLVATRESSTNWVRSEMTSRYLNLKDRAWANLLRSSKVESKLSSSAQRRMETAFDEIKTLEFTVTNIHGFLQGLMENQGSIMRQMACDVFDLITRYHTDNVVFYKGWVSNSKQRTCGMRLKKSRFVIPGNLNFFGSSTLSYEAERRLADFDRVLAMLDGKDAPEVSLTKVFRTHWRDLTSGERVSSSYLDVRFYPKAGTIHFFPRSQEIMDKLNRMVGEQRQWLPTEAQEPSDAFMRQYNDADRFDKELRAELDVAQRAKRAAGRYVSDFDHPLRAVMRVDEAEENAKLIDEALTKVHERHGISVDFQLQHKPATQEGGQQLLLAA